MFLKNILTNSCFEYLLCLTLIIKCSFGLNTLESTVKTPSVDLMRLKTLRNTKCLFFNPYKVQQTPHPYLYGTPPPELPRLIAVFGYISARVTPV